MYDINVMLLVYQQPEEEEGVDEPDSDRRADEEMKELAFQQAYVWGVQHRVMVNHSVVLMCLRLLPLGLTVRCVPLCPRTSLHSKGDSSKWPTSAPHWLRGGSRATVTIW